MSGTPTLPAQQAERVIDLLTEALDSPSGMPRQKEGRALVEELRAALASGATQLSTAQGLSDALDALRDLEAMAERYRLPGHPIPDAQKRARAILASKETK